LPRGACFDAAVLEQEARELGSKRIQLETGSKQPEAISLYETSGFGRIPNFGPYVGEASSVCLELVSIDDPLTGCDQ